MNSKKPVGLKILGFLFILVSLLGYLFLFIASDTTYPRRFQVYMVIWNTIFISAGIGLVNLKKWSRMLALVLVSVKSIQMFIGSVRDTATLLKLSAEPIVVVVAVITTILILTIWMWIIHYLTRPAIIEQFEK